MKKIMFFLLPAVLCFVISGYSKTKPFRYYEKINDSTSAVYVNTLPRNVEEFLALRSKIARYPEGGVVMFILAAKIYTENKAEGLKCFTIALARNNLRKNMKGYKGFIPNSSFNYKLQFLDRMPYAPDSYIDGTSPETGYQLPEPPYKFILSTNKYSKRPNGAVKFFILTSGADNPRPFTVKANNKGIWKIYGNASSFFTGIKKPAVEDDDDL